MGHRIKASTAVIAAISLLGVAGIHANGASVAPGPTQALLLYRKSLSGSEAFCYAGRQYITTWRDDGRSSTVVAQVYHDAPDQYLLRFIAPKDRSGRAILENHSYEWTYIPGRNVVIQTPRPVSQPDENTSALLLANYSITMSTKPDLIANRSTYVITLTSKSRHDKALRFWVDPYTGVSLRTERYHAGGNLAYVSYFSDINFSPKFGTGLFTPQQWPKATLDRQLYKARLSENLNPTDLAAPFGGCALAPSHIREYSLVGATRMSSQYRPTLHLHYSDGLSSLSLFETLKRNRRATRMAGSLPVRIGAAAYGRISERFNYSLLNWDSDRLSMTLLGDLSPDTLVDLAGALAPSTPSISPRPAATVRLTTHR